MVKRELYMQKIRPFIGRDVIKVITGIRRCGKSVMLGLIKEELLLTGVKAENIIALNFENMANTAFCNAVSLRSEILARTAGLRGRVYLFFDEIQEVAGWEKCINSLRGELDCDIYITGSNAALLSGELATYIAGRYVAFTVYPFSFAEYLLTPGGASAQNLSAAFREYLLLGGMPFLGNIRGSREACRQYLRDIYSSVVLKDIVMRHGIRDAAFLDRLILYLFANVGQTFSATGIAKYFKSERRRVSAETILNYLKACGEAFLIYKAPRYDTKGKRILTVNEKYYIADHGIRQALCGSDASSIGQVLENIVCLELLRRGYSVTVGDAQGREIDFIGEKDGRRLYIQVAYLLAAEETVRREFGAFTYVKDNYPKYVVSLDEFDFSRDGVRHMNIRDFLLADEWGA